MDCNVITAIQGGEEFDIRRGLHQAGLDGSTCEFYNNHVQDYEKYSASTGRDVGAQAVVKVIAEKYPDKNTLILDVCAGTGLAGMQLKQLGYTEVDALDFSQEMLNLAKSRGIYQNYICDSVEKNQIEKDTYDALCMNGGMVPGHITPEVLPQLTRITKSGGLIVFNITNKTMTHVSELKEEVVDAKVQSFVDEGTWTAWTKHTATYYNSTGELCTIYTGIVA